MSRVVNRINYTIKTWTPNKPSSTNLTKIIDAPELVLMVHPPDMFTLKLTHKVESVKDNGIFSRKTGTTNMSLDCRHGMVILRDWLSKGGTSE